MKVGVLRGTAHSISSKTFLILSGRSLNLVDFVKRDTFESLCSVSTFHDQSVEGTYEPLGKGHKNGL